MICLRNKEFHFHRIHISVKRTIRDKMPLLFKTRKANKTQSISLLTKTINSLLVQLIIK